jgi:EmrB/QacA subfamily drug resistance transporter
VDAEARTETNPYAHKWLVLAAVCIALFMALLDGSIVNVAIPNIAKGLNADFSDIEWVLNAYTLVFASLLVTFGRLGDMFGRKRYFIVGLATFGIGSLLCGLSSSVEMLIASRVVQATGAAFMMPATLSLTAVNFPAEQRGMAMGIWGAVTGIATAVGPSLGGWITEAAAWNYIFFINVPIVILAIPFALWAIPESRDERPHTVDWVGALLSILMLGSFSFALIEGPSLGWNDALVMGLLVAAVGLFGIFLWWERRAAEPIMDLKLFRDPAFSAGNASGAILMFGMMGMFFMLPIYMQINLGYDAIKTGFALTPMSAAILVSAPLSGRLSDRIGSRWLVFAGMLTAAGAVMWLSFLPYGGGWQFLVGPLVVAGVGMGLVMAPMTSAVMAVAPKGEEGAASGVLSTMRQVGGLFGIAVLGALFQTAIVANLVTGVAGIEQLPEPARRQLAARIEESGTSIMDRGTGGSMSDMRSMLPTDAVMPVISDAVRAAARETLPSAFGGFVASAVVAEIEAGTPLEGDAMMQALASKMPPGATSSGASGIREQFAAFGQAIGQKIEAAFSAVGKAMMEAISKAFVDAMRSVFRLASIILAAGAFLALFLRSGRNASEDKEVTG